MPEPLKRVLLTGATGFIGRHLAAALAHQGWRVRGAARTAGPHQVPGVEEWVVTGPVGSETDWDPALQEVTAVVHLAALAHRTDPTNQPAEADYMEVNARGTRRLAEAVARLGAVQRFVLVSSIGAVADVCNTPMDETSLASPVTPYGRSKLAAEQAVRELFRPTGIEWCVLRPVLVYGPGNPGNMARLLRLVRTGLPLPFGGMDNRRNFLFVGNLVGAIERVLTVPGLSGRTFHVADDDAVSTADLIRLLAQAADRPVRLYTVPDWSLRLAAGCGDFAERLGLRTGLNSYSLRKLEESLVVSNQALRTATGWQPASTLLDGLRRTLGPTPEEKAIS